MKEQQWQLMAINPAELHDQTRKPQSTIPVTLSFIRSTYVGVNDEILLACSELVEKCNSGL